MKGLQITCEDCMELMGRYPDKYFDLAIIDPPYGIGMDGGNVGYKGNNNLPQKNWDKEKPNGRYFNELSRVSSNQIIWGGNYFGLKPTRCFLVWDKGEGFYNRTYAECELAWTSFDSNTCKVKYDPLCRGDYKGKIHPTQKPVALYKWLLTNYAKPGNKILDTHLGSGSIAIACYDMGFELTACELDPDYYRDAMERIRKHTEQQALFTPQEMYRA